MSSNGEEPPAQPAANPTISIPIERTLAMIKPDASSKSVEIEDIILRSEFAILQKRKVHMTPEEASEFYTEHFGKVFFPSLVAFMSSGPVVALVLARQNAVKHWRELIGPTDSKVARVTHPDSIRAIYGTENPLNAVHGSDSQASAEREIRFFFPDTITEPIQTQVAAKDYLNTYVSPTLLQGLTQLCKEKPKDSITWLADWLMDNNPIRPRVKNGGPIVEEPK